jgi:hypothetical protein
MRCAAQEPCSGERFRFHPTIFPTDKRISSPTWQTPNDSLSFL